MGCEMVALPRIRSGKPRVVVPLSPQFQLSEDAPDEHTQVICVQGEIHVSTAPDFSQRLNETIAAGKRYFVLDLSGVTFIDSTGLGVLLNGLRRIHRVNGRMTLVCTNPTVLRLFHVTGLDSTFDIAPTRAEAIARVHA
jgi:anti-sigma B factor antagonist